MQHTTGKTGGMGSPRVSRGQDPDRPDDSQLQQLEALEQADLAQLKDEDISTGKPLTAERDEVQAMPALNFSEEELDNQDPHAAPGVGKHGAHTRDAPPQELNSETRVGEGLKPGIRRSLEQSDLDLEG